MKSKILISINPEHVENIINLTKRYEYRTKVAKKDIDSLIVYSTFPEKKVVAEVEIIEVLSYDPNTLWELTSSESSISKKYFDQYFNGREIAHAYKLGKVKVFENPKTLLDFGVKFAPQSYIYLS